ncbi:MAG: class I tRNA ligase family protein [Flavipsychrobacter sp.]
MEYNFGEIEQNARKFWKENEVYKVSNNSDKPKYYVLDMFPYPSGAGLHVGHPLGYIASDIFARYKRLKGFNVLHPMGYDAFGLPAEQYALETGQHPADTTEQNIARYRQQLDNIGFCYDWSREVRTSDPKYYKWTQWIFLQLFHSWFDRTEQKAKPLTELISLFEQEGNTNHTCPADDSLSFSAEKWKAMPAKEQREVLMQYRLAYLSHAEVWWCEALGTVLANDEVQNGVSERGGHPVVKKRMNQWFLRITEYAERLLSGFDNLSWTDAMKEMQRNWIGKSEGAEVDFPITGTDKHIKVFTTRPDTIFGVDFMVVAPEHDLVNEITTAGQKTEVEKYRAYVQSRSERERMTEVKSITGAFTGAYVTHPFTQQQVPVWISEYVLAGYGTGAIMAVPAGDERDHAFAKHFNIPITNIFGNNYNGEEAYTDKKGTIENSDFLNGIAIPESISVAVKAIEEKGLGTAKINYKLRDAGFSRQRYWGEPFPIVYIDGQPYATDENEAAGIDQTLPVELPKVDNYKPGPEGQGPLANEEDWVNTAIGKRETNTMPGYAGSSWYFLRYMDPHNDETFADRKATDYWQAVDVYVGGTEHAVGHLLYSRMWTKALYDLGHIGFDEPFKQLINQGMIQGSSRFVYRLNTDAASFLILRTLKKHFSGYEFKSEYENIPIEADYFSEKEGIAIIVTYQKNIQKRLAKLSDTYKHIQIILISREEIFEIYQRDISELKTLLSNIFNNEENYYSKKDRREFYISYNRLKEFDKSHVDKQHINIKYVDGLELDIEQLRKDNILYSKDEFLLEDQKYICSAEVEKMSKSKYNVVNPDGIVAQYGADTFRMYEMFLGPIEVSKPWDTKGIEGVHRFLKKLWRLYADDQKGWIVTDEEATNDELKLLHKTIKKIGDDIERFSFNTSVAQFMICVNELTTLNCHKRAILEPLAIAIAPFAPHLAEELWHKLGHKDSVTLAPFPTAEEKYLVENTKKYPIAINGKTRDEMEFPLDIDKAELEQQVLANETVIKWMEGKTLRKFIYVPGRMINVVVG